MTTDEREYTCECCSKVFIAGWSDEEANAEALQIFGTPDADKKAEAGEMATVCHTCFEKMARYFAEQ